MQISVRSYLTAGTVAVVGAGSIALTPVLPSTLASTANLPAPTVAQVALTGTSFSINDVLGVLGDLGGISGLPAAIIGALGDLGGISVPGISGLPSDLLSSIASEFIKETIPVVLEAAGPFIDYLQTTVSGLLIGPNSIPVQVVNALPAALGSLGSIVGTGDFGAVLQALGEGLAAPIAAAKQALADVATQFQAFVSGQLGTIIGALPAVLISAIQKVVGVNLSDALGAISTVVAGLFSGASVINGLPVNKDKGGTDSEGTDSEGADSEDANDDADENNAGEDANDDADENNAGEDANDEESDDDAEAAASVAPRAAAARRAVVARVAAAVAPAPAAAAEAVTAPEAPVAVEAPAAPEAPAEVVKAPEAPAAADNAVSQPDSLGAAVRAPKPITARAKQTLRGRVAAARSAAVARATAAADASK